MPTLIVDGKIVKCNNYLELTTLHKKIMSLLKKPKTRKQLSKDFPGALGTLYRTVYELMIHGIVECDKINGRQKIFRLKK